MRCRSKFFVIISESRLTPGITRRARNAQARRLADEAALFAVGACRCGARAYADSFSGHRRREPAMPAHHNRHYLRPFPKRMPVCARPNVSLPTATSNRSPISDSTSTRPCNLEPCSPSATLIHSPTPPSYCRGRCRSGRTLGKGEEEDSADDGDENQNPDDCLQRVSHFLIIRVHA